MHLHDIKADIPVTPITITYDSLRFLLPKRETQSHKGDFGHVLIIGGDHGFGGAAMLAAQSAARVGAGLVSIATRPEHISSILAHSPEIMCQGIEHPENLEPLLNKASVIVIGPGLGQTDWSIEIFTQVMQAQQSLKVPMVMDADALNLLSLGLCSDLTQSISKWVLTPHPGEASRLLGINTDEISRNREQVIIALQKRFGGVSVLKGSGSLICFEKEHNRMIERCEHGNPGMATGGMGDILSGIIGGLIAQHLTLSDASRLGVCLHALSADKSAAQDGERGMIATDLLPWIRLLANP